VPVFSIENEGVGRSRDFALLVMSFGLVKGSRLFEERGRVSRWGLSQVAVISVISTLEVGNTSDAEFLSF